MIGKFVFRKKVKSIKGVRRIAKKFEFSYMDYLYFMANGMLSLDFNTNRRLRSKEDFESNKYVEELKYYSDTLALRQDFNSSLGMYSYASNSVVICILLLSVILFLSLCLNVSTLESGHKFLIAMATIIFGCAVSFRNREHYPYLIISIIVYPNNSKFKIIKFFSEILSRLLFLCILVVDVLTLLGFSIL